MWSSRVTCILSFFHNILLVRLQAILNHCNLILTPRVGENASSGRVTIIKDTFSKFDWSFEIG
ncbi:hypothetical protein M758_7G049500 [Ceratodon purpureus]|nr:hypothetical protein M758_7G049500 [Ceratodon purpureus]